MKEKHNINERDTMRKVNEISEKIDKNNVLNFIFRKKKYGNN
jgi:hypothetical protein